MIHCSLSQSLLNVTYILLSLLVNFHASLILNLWGFTTMRIFIEILFFNIALSWFNFKYTDIYRLQILDFMVEHPRKDFINVINRSQKERESLVFIEFIQILILLGIIHEKNKFLDINIYHFIFVYKYVMYFLFIWMQAFSF
jgi:hypothetical protein